MLNIFALQQHVDGIFGRTQPYLSLRLSQNCYFDRSNPWPLIGYDVNQLETPFSRLIEFKCSWFSFKRFCSAFWTFLCIFSYSILIVVLILFCSIPFTEYSTSWSLIKPANDDVSFFKFSNSIPAFSWNSGIPSPPNPVIRTWSSFEQMCPPVRRFRFLDKRFSWSIEFSTNDFTYEPLKSSLPITVP